MTTRCKFRCDSIERVASTKPGPDGKYVPCEAVNLRFSPVYPNGNPEHENSKFWQATPSGQLQLSIVNIEATTMFAPGKEYYLDISPAD